MSYEITLDEMPAGYLCSVNENGEAVVCIREFSSSEDGDSFISRLEGIPAKLISLLPRESGIRAGIVDHLLAIIRPDKTATVYVNELNITLKVQIKRSMEAGSLVYADDVADVDRLSFNGVSFPNNAGILFLFSVGWRKGLFFDFSVLGPNTTTPREYDPEVLFGQYYAYLDFQQLFKITDDEWKSLLAQGWFPFISLTRKTLKDIFGHLRSGQNIDDLTEKIAEEVNAMIPSMVERWKSSPIFQQHGAIFEQAAERYLQQDYISATSILYPRIEGLMRSYHLSLNKPDRASQGNLVSAVVEGKGHDSRNYSFLLPDNFRRYLKEVYFAGFDPQNPTVLSRHSVSHGVAPVSNFALKETVIGLLILDQLSYYIGPTGKSL
jgi:hypothetical protein